MPTLPPPAMLGKAGCPTCNGTGSVHGHPRSFGYLLLEQRPDGTAATWEAPDGALVVLPTDRSVIARRCDCVESFYRAAIMGPPK